MLRPHHGVHRQFEMVGGAPEDLLDLLRLIVGETQRAMDVLAVGLVRFGSARHGPEPYPSPTRALVDRRDRRRGWPHKSLYYCSLMLVGICI
jgi:hypothetical protein